MGAYPWKPLGGVLLGSYSELSLPFSEVCIQVCQVIWRLEAVLFVILSESDSQDTFLFRIWFSTLHILPWPTCYIRNPNHPCQWLSQTVLQDLNQDSLLSLKHALREILALKDVWNLFMDIYHLWAIYIIGQLIKIDDLPECLGSPGKISFHTYFFISTTSWSNPLDTTSTLLYSIFFVQ